MSDKRRSVIMGFSEILLVGFNRRPTVISTTDVTSKYNFFLQMFSFHQIHPPTPALNDGWGTGREV